MHVVATAGHVDHGKSTLVRMLTGMEPDRWAEERRRGMTIDLGYAWTDLPSGERVAFVDVPGHEKFLANMLAGVGPVPAVMLVVASDEGWRAQTEEHVAALRAFGVEHVVLVVTRSDLRDPADACEESLRRLGAFGLANVETVSVSGHTGQGRDALVAALDRLVAGVPPSQVDAPARLWVDRVFAIRGAGVVLTGTLQSGRIAVGDDLQVAPAGDSYSVRGLESCKEKCNEVQATARVAVNLRGADVDAVHRGDCLVAAGTWVPARELDVVLSDPLGEGTLTLHVGSAAVSVRVRPLGAAPALFARLSLRTALPLRVDDRALLRSPGSHGRAVGARVLDINPPALRRRGAAAQRAQELSGARAGPGVADLVRWHTVLHRDRTHAMHPAAELPTASGRDVVVAKSWLVSAATWEQWRGSLCRAVTATADDLARGRSRGELVQLLGLPDDAVLDALVDELELEEVRGWVRPAGAVQRWSDDVESALGKVESRLRKDPFQAPPIAELDALGIDQRIRGIATDAGRLVQISRDVYLLPEAIDIALERLGALAQPFTVSEARQRLDTTRRVVVPLLEHLDGAGHTRRVDDSRRMLVRR